LNVIDLPELAGLFGPASSAEVSVAGRVAVGQQMIDVAGQMTGLVKTRMKYWWPTTDRQALRAR